MRAAHLGLALVLLGGSGGTAGARPRAQTQVRPLTVVDSLPDPESGDPIDVRSACIDGDELVVDAGHAGGCAVHDYELSWAGRSGAPLPASMDLVLIHRSNGDTCEAYLQPTLRFDISQLRASTGEEDITLFVRGNAPVSVAACS
jgi:hypothetical protein